MKVNGSNALFAHANCKNKFTKSEEKHRIRTTEKRIKIQKNYNNNNNDLNKKNDTFLIDNVIITHVHPYTHYTSAKTKEDDEKKKKSERKIRNSTRKIPTISSHFFSSSFCSVSFSLSCFRTIGM